MWAVMWASPGIVTCDTLRLSLGSRHSTLSSPAISGVSPHPACSACTAAHCWVLRLKLTPGATQIWDRVGIDIDPSQTNGRPQISECGAAWSWEAHQLRQSRDSLENVLRKLCVMGVSVTGWWLGCDQVSAGNSDWYTDTQHCHELETRLARPDKSNWWSHSFIVHCRPLHLMSALILADLWCEVWGDHRYPPAPPSPITSGGSQLSLFQLGPGGSPANTYLTFGQFARSQWDPTVTNWRDWQLACSGRSVWTLYSQN